MAAIPPSYEMATLSVERSGPDDKPIGLDNPAYEAPPSAIAETGDDIQLQGNEI